MKLIELCPKILGFEKAGMLFKDPNWKGLYSISVEKAQDGEYYIRDTA